MSDFPLFNIKELESFHVAQLLYRMSIAEYLLFILYLLQFLAIGTEWKLDLCLIEDGDSIE